MEKKILTGVQSPWAAGDGMQIFMILMICYENLFYHCIISALYPRGSTKKHMLPCSIKWPIIFQGNPS